MSSLRYRILAVLIIILIGLIITKINLPCGFSDEGFFMHMITEMISAIIIFIAIDWSIGGREEREQERLRLIAISSLRQPIRRYLWAWLHAAHSDENLKTQLTNISLEEYLLSDNFISPLINRSFNEPFGSPIFGVAAKPIREKFPVMIDDFQNDIKDILRTYAHAFNGDNVRLLQHFSENAHLYNVIRFRRTTDIGINKWFSNVTSQNIREHFERFIQLLNLYNSSVPENERWTNMNILNLNRVSGEVPNVQW